MDKILRNDLESFSLPEELTGRLHGATILLTGATGLIGSSFVRCIDALEIGVKWILPVRDTDKALRILGDSGVDISDGHITLETSELKQFFESTPLKADFVVHCAAPTNGRYMTEHPVETFRFMIESTDAALDYCRRAGAKGMVYASSIEYYGMMSDDSPVTEDATGTVDHGSPRSCYPLGKQASEFLCVNYAHEYGVPCTIARLTQTFGAGIPATDNRVFAQFARSVIAGTDIVLHTEGTSAKPYCYTTDCISALVHILLKGTPGEAYNVATPGTYVSIRRLADLFRETLNPSISVVTRPVDAGYAPETRVNLDSSRLLHLGWKPVYDLPEMIRRLTESMRAVESGKQS